MCIRDRVNPEKSESSEQIEIKEVIVIPDPQDFHLNKLKELEEEVLSAFSLYTRSIGSYQDKFNLQQELLRISQEAFKLTKNTKNSSEIIGRCLNIIRAANFPILEASKPLEQPSAAPQNDRSFIVRYMQPYGFRSFSEISNKFTKLSDWVDVAANTADSFL
eukprot:TRINITY_DN7962_c0_g3_i8.p1 TRINITY_DN7962_c0_g3~~TRINITY_DN7962_c0_g3_i8.p1  ORF type:complete len:162 (+),score=26.44 TRINITY_DN7962_c0_g3_i8:86-571(+)